MERLELGLVKATLDLLLGLLEKPQAKVVTKVVVVRVLLRDT